MITVAQDGTYTSHCMIPNAFWIDYTSDGTLVVANQASQIFRVKDGVVSAGINDLAFPRDRATGVTVSVDRNGTLGPKDDIYFIAVMGRANNTFYRFSQSPTAHRVRPDGTTGERVTYMQEWDNVGYAPVGNLNYCNDPQGHYPWVCEVHPDEAALLMQGFSSCAPR